MATTMSLRDLLLNPDYLRAALESELELAREDEAADIQRAVAQPDATFAAAQLDKAADRFLDAIDSDLREYREYVTREVLAAENTAGSPEPATDAAGPVTVDTIDAFTRAEMIERIEAMRENGDRESAFPLLDLAVQQLLVVGSPCCVSAYLAADEEALDFDGFITVEATLPGAARTSVATWYERFDDHDVLVNWGREEVPTPEQVCQRIADGLNAAIKHITTFA